MADYVINESWTSEEIDTIRSLYYSDELTKKYFFSRRKLAVPNCKIVDIYNYIENEKKLMKHIKLIYLSDMLHILS